MLQKYLKDVCNVQTAIPTKEIIRQSVFIEIARLKKETSPNDFSLFQWLEQIPKDLKFKYDFLYNLEYWQYWDSLKTHSDYLAHIEDVSNPESPIVFSQIGLLS